MKTATTRTGPESRWGLAALILLSAGWLVAVVLGDGFELHRSALAAPLIVAAALCGLVESVRTGRVIWGPALVAGAVAMLYFVVRALLSPVWDLGRHDLHLIALLWATIATVATCAGTPRRAALLVAVVILVFLGHLGAGLYQRFVDPEWVLLRLPRRSSGGVSGLFWTWNNLAAFLALALPLFLALALTTRALAVRILFLLLVAAGLVLAYFSKSRAGFVAVVVGLGATVGVFLFWRAHSWSWSARLGALTALAILALVPVLTVPAIVSRVSEERGHSSDLNRALGESFRLPLAGMAVDLWFERLLVGHGSQSYRYLAVKKWDDESLPVWIGNPETVHNEYLQVLSDYGLLGFVLVMAFILLVLGRLVIPPGEDERGRLVRALRLGAAGALVGTMVHAAVDFQLHLLPILVLAGIMVGALLATTRRAGLPSRVLHAVTVLAAVVLAVVAVGKENLATPRWLSWQGDVLRAGGSIEPAALSRLKGLVESSPHYEVALHYGRLRYDQAFRESVPDRELLEEAAWGLEIAYRRNPFDQTTLVTYALILDQLGRSEDATAVHLEAVGMAARREHKYGAMAGLADNLLRRGEALYMKRRPEEALGFFLRARDYLEASRARSFTFGGGDGFKQRKQLLESRISLLEAAGIEPRAPSGVPSPPES